jgi:hypothetical protein
MIRRSEKAVAGRNKFAASIALSGASKWPSHVLIATGHKRNTLGGFGCLSMSVDAQHLHFVESTPTPVNLLDKTYV